MSANVRARILNGGLAGREIALPGAELKIGGDDADLAIVLDDHVSVTATVGTDGVFLDRAVPCWVKGQLFDAGKPLPLNVALDIAGCGIAFSIDDTPLSTVKFVRRRSSKAIAIWIVAVSLVLFSAVAATTFFWVAHSNARREVVQNRETAIAQVKAELEKAGVVVVRGDNGSIELRGECRTAAEVEPLRLRLSAQQVLFRDQLVCEDQMLASVRATLALYGYSEARVVAGPKPSTVNISGAIVDDARWQKTAKTLAEIPGLQHWSVNDGAQDTRDLINRLRDSSLLGSVSVTRSNDILFITGKLDAAASTRLAALSAAFAQAHPNAPRILHQDLAADTMQVGILPSQVVSIGGYGDERYLELENGTRLRVGSRLANGYEVVGIGTGGVDLMKRDTLVHLSIVI